MKKFFTKRGIGWLISGVFTALALDVLVPMPYDLVASALVGALVGIRIATLPRK